MCIFMAIFSMFFVVGRLIGLNPLQGWSPVLPFWLIGINRRITQLFGYSCDLDPGT